MLKVRNLCTWFPRRVGLLGRIGGHIKAVDEVSFSITAGKAVGLVGESGSGKSTVGRTLLKLYGPGEALIRGEVAFEGQDILPLAEAEFRPLRREMQMVFQDPFGSLNPRQKVASILGEPLEVHCPKMTASDRRERGAELLQQVGLPADALDRFPHEFSGGQRQRIGVARALAVRPKFLILDEPVSALDVSVQAQIVNLLQDLQEQLGLTYLFIGHDLAVIEHLCSEVLVMYRGKLVEAGSREQVFGAPQHDYTKRLLRAAGG
ncbi:MAG: ABC transporter ATP-binding protein [Verrucomicrobia bacterium]|nr:ABC transporter ATP-binding protein [Verrucomicrobiota bacterium]